MKSVNGGDHFVENIAETLRAPEQVRPDFDARVMSNLRGAVAPGVFRSSGSWWRRPRVYRITRLGQLAMAAGVAALAVAAWTFARAGTQPSERPSTRTAVASADTVHLVRFVFVDSSATRVALVGSFNQWRRDATVFTRTAVPGVWAVQVALPPGRHEYAFVASNGSTERWIADPWAPRHHDEFGTETSLIWVRPHPAS